MTHTALQQHLGHTAYGLDLLEIELPRALIEEVNTLVPALKNRPSVAPISPPFQPNDKRHKDMLLPGETPLSDLPFRLLEGT